MKKILISIILICGALMSLTLPPVDKTKVPIKNVQGLQDSLAAKVNIATLESATATFYTKDQTDSIAALKANLASPTFTGTPLVPTAAAGTNTTQAASTAFVNTNSMFYYGITAIGNTFKSQTLGSTMSGLTTSSLTSGRVYLILLNPIKVGTIITGLKTQAGSTTASFTENNFNGVALFKVMNDGTYSRVAISNDLTSQFKLADGTTAVFPFITPYTTEDAMYVAAILYNSSAQTTAPSFYSISSSYQALKIFNTTNANISCYLASQTSIPSSITVSATTIITSNPILIFAY